MYQVLRRETWLKILLLVAGAIGVVVWLFMKPTDLSGWFRTLSATISITAVLVTLLGTVGWKLLWLLCPVFNDWVCPDLSGRWRVTIESNIDRIAQHHPSLAGKTITNRVQGTAEIKQNWFRIFISLKMDSQYSHSRTTCVHLLRDEQSGRVSLSYVYENDTPEPVDTDEQRHFGAARVRIEKAKKGYELKGEYWTNRNWAAAMNTAGRVSFIKSPKQ